MAHISAHDTLNPSGEITELIGQINELIEKFNNIINKRNINNSANSNDIDE